MDIWEVNASNKTSEKRLYNTLNKIKIKHYIIDAVCQFEWSQKLETKKNDNLKQPYFKNKIEDHNFS